MGVDWGSTASKNFIDVGAGVIDADYRGQVKILLFNHADTAFEIAAGDRIAQLILERVCPLPSFSCVGCGELMGAQIYTPDVVVVEELEESVRGAGGFGSTGN